MLVDAALRSDEVVECPKNGHTAENLRSELICIIVDWCSEGWDGWMMMMKAKNSKNGSI
jgi:hypothetical protein